MNNTIEIQNLNFSFDKDNQIINDLSLSMNKGGFLSVLGASGSGKSTLLRVLSNILPANKSQILDGNVSIFGKTPQEYLDTGKLSFMFQEASLMPNLNVKENIAFPLKLRGENIDSSFVNELLEIVGLSEHSTKFPSELSGGMKTRVSLARAFITKPELLLLDEPFSALDISWKSELYYYLNQFRQKYNTTIILVSHDIQEAILLSDNIFLLSTAGDKLSYYNLSKKNKITAFNFDDIKSILKDNMETQLGIQSQILIDGYRGKSDLNTTLNFLRNVEGVLSSKTAKIEPIIWKKLNTVRDFLDNQTVLDYFIKFWNSTNDVVFKYEILFQLTQSSLLSKEMHDEIEDFIKYNIVYLTGYAKNQQYFPEETCLSDIRGRLNSNSVNESKKWVYPYLLWMSLTNSKYEKNMLEYLNELLSNNNEKVVRSTSYILNELENEK